MRSLFDINSEIETTLDSLFSVVDAETGEIIDEQVAGEIQTKLDELEVEKGAKLEAVGLYIKTLAVEADALKQEESNLKERRRRKEKHAEGLKAWLSVALDGQKFETPKVAVAFRKSTAVRITDESTIAPEYVKIKEERTVDKVAIKKALQGGLEIAGAELVTNNNITVK